VRKNAGLGSIAEIFSFSLIGLLTKRFETKKAISSNVVIKRKSDRKSAGIIKNNFGAIIVNELRNLFIIASIIV
jgi:hypothetical protein